MPGGYPDMEARRRVLDLLLRKGEHASDRQIHEESGHSRHLVKVVRKQLIEMGVLPDIYKHAGVVRGKDRWIGATVVSDLEYAQAVRKSRRKKR